jgi:hypothetical protein
MYSPVRRSRRALLLVAALGTSLAAGACGGSASESGSAPPVATSSPATTSSAAPGGPTPVPGATAAPTPSATVTPTTDTAWGPIWDDIPANFPVFPGSEVGEPIDAPASAVFAAPADSTTVTAWYQEALETATYSTLSLSGPFEDGSTVIESTGETPECLVETTLRPESGSTIVTILYGAGCPVPAG